MEYQNKVNNELELKKNRLVFISLVIVTMLFLLTVVGFCFWQNKKISVLGQEKDTLLKERNDIDAQLFNSITRVGNLQAEIEKLKKKVSFLEENNQNLTFDKNYDWQEYEGGGYRLKFPKDWRYLTCMDGVQFFLYPTQIEKETCDEPRVNYPFSIEGPGSLPRSVEMAARTKKVEINGIEAVQYFKIPSGQDLSSNVYVDMIAIPSGDKFYKIYLKNGVEDFTIAEVAKTFSLK